MAVPPRSGDLPLVFYRRRPSAASDWATIGQGTRTDLATKATQKATKQASPASPEPVYNINKLKRGGTGASYLLRRIARETPEVLAAYERGKFTSVAAAARAAGIIKKENPLAAVRRAWKNANPKQRREIAIFQ